MILEPISAPNEMPSAFLFMPDTATDNSGNAAPGPMTSMPMSVFEIPNCPAINSALSTTSIPPIIRMTRPSNAIPRCLAVLISL